MRNEGVLEGAEFDFVFALMVKAQCLVVDGKYKKL
jgi:hypothetical protein